jgi:hypothetical protein
MEAVYFPAAFNTTYTILYNPKRRESRKFKKIDIKFILPPYDINII